MRFLSAQPIVVGNYEFSGILKLNRTTQESRISSLLLEMTKCTPQIWIFCAREIIISVIWRDRMASREGRHMMCGKRKSDAGCEWSIFIAFLFPDEFSLRTPVK